MTSLKTKYTNGTNSTSHTSSHDQSPLPQRQDINVQVAIRCRPLNEREKALKRHMIVQCKANSHEISVQKRKSYTFDKVYGQYSTQKDIFHTTVKPVVDEALNGYNCTVFAYGQTGTGKTYTMQGEIVPDHEHSGIIPRSIKYIFDTLQSSDREFCIKISFLQLYNEELKDLLAPDEVKKLRLMDDIKRGGIYCQNLLEVTANSIEQVFELVEMGVKNRITSETLMNENSSRSHSIFTIRIHSKEKSLSGGEDLLKIGQLNLVDLAGSECIGRSGANKERAREAGNINQSLLTLGRVITALVDRHPHVPYRDSKLTRLLQESLGGRVKTTIIATLAPCIDSLEETMSTLEYAHRARSILNKPEVNQKVTKSKLLKEYGTEIEGLRTALQAAREKDGVYLPTSQYTEMQERISSQDIQLNELEHALELRDETCRELEDTVDTLVKQTTELKQSKRELEGQVENLQSELAASMKLVEKTQLELENTKRRLNAFEKNEVILLQNGSLATELYNASEQRSQLLHEKIDRKQHIELANSKLTESFSTNAITKLKAFEDSIRQQENQQKILFEDSTAGLNKLHSCHRTDIEELGKCFAELESLVRQRNENFVLNNERETENDAQALTSVKDFILANGQSMDEQIQVLLTKSLKHVAALNRIRSDMQKQQTIFKESFETNLSNSHNILQTFFMDQKQQFVQLQEIVAAAIKKQNVEMKEFDNSFVETLGASCVKQKQEMKELKSNIVSLFDKWMDRQNEFAMEQTRSLADQSRRRKEAISELGNNVSNGLSRTSTFIEDQQLKSIEQKEQLAHMVSQHAQKCSTQEEQLEGYIKTQERDQQVWCDNFKTVTTTQKTGLLNLHDEHEAKRVMNRQLQKDQQLKFQSNYTDGYTKCNQQVESLSERLQSNHDHLETVFKKSQVTHTNFINDCISQTRNQSNQIHSYVKNKKVDLVTGSTPVKGKRKRDETFPTFLETDIPEEKENQRESITTLPEEKRMKTNVNNITNSPQDNDDTNTQALVKPKPITGVLIPPKRYTHIR